VGRQVTCQRCNAAILLPAPLASIAVIRRERRTSRRGLVLEIGGFALMVFFPLGTILGIVLVVIGWRQSFLRVCGNCGTPLRTPEQGSCSRCRAAFTEA
jgi:hypothetical protein